jgi:hypothetical protein
MILRVQDSKLLVCKYTRDEKKRVGVVGGGPSDGWEAGVLPGQQRRNKDF